MICGKCNQENLEENQFCSKCGTNLKESKETNQKNNFLSTKVIPLLKKGKDIVTEKDFIKKHRKKIIIFLSIIVLVVAFFTIYNKSATNINLAKYSKEVQKIIYAIEYDDISSLDETSINKLKNELQKSMQQLKGNSVKTIDTSNIVKNYFLGVSMLSNNFNTDNTAIIANVKNALLEGEEKYKYYLNVYSSIDKYEELAKKEEYQEIDRQNGIDKSLKLSERVNITSKFYRGSTDYYYVFNPQITNNSEKSIKYIDFTIDICNGFNESLESKSYQGVGPIEPNSNGGFTFKNIFISDSIRSVITYMNISKVKITYLDETTITFEGEQIDIGSCVISK